MITAALHWHTWNRCTRVIASCRDNIQVAAGEVGPAVTLSKMAITNQLGNNLLPNPSAQNKQLLSN